MNWEIDGNKSIRKIIILSTPATTPPIQGNRGQNSLVSLLELIVFGAGIFTRSHKLSIDIAIWFLSTAVAPASLHSNKLCKTILLPNLALQSHNPSSRTSESGPKNSFPRYIQIIQSVNMWTPHLQLASLTVERSTSDLHCIFLERAQRETTCLHETPVGSGHTRRERFGNLSIPRNEDAPPFLLDLDVQ